MKTIPEGHEKAGANDPGDIERIVSVDNEIVCLCEFDSLLVPGFSAHLQEIIDEALPVLRSKLSLA